MKIPKDFGWNCFTLFLVSAEATRFWPEHNWAWIPMMLVCGLLSVKLAGKWFVENFELHLPITRRSPEARCAKARLRLFISKEHDSAELVGQFNVYRWFFLRHNVTGIDAEGQPTIIHTWILFVVFEKEISAQALRVTFNAPGAPRHDIRDFCPRQAIIVFYGELPTATLEISAEEEDIAAGAPRMHFPNGRAAELVFTRLRPIPPQLFLPSPLATVLDFAESKQPEVALAQMPPELIAVPDVGHQNFCV